ncbi:helix-turn-helix domain-containing protein [Flagellimonas sp.]|uniref:helix-turn-helix domain-containing protein n=1 Tax=Flagellimonas sp. TaxID=2058762 RepID=UPI003B5C62E1
MQELSKDQELLKLATRVAQLRDQKGVSQQNAFNDTGIHFGRIEQGKRDISYFTLLKLCQYFEISLKDFFDGSFDAR